MQTMADEILEEIHNEENNIQEDNKVEKRIKELSNKVKTTSQERDDLVAAKKESDAERDNAKKEVEFYSAFSDTTDKYPNAKDFKDQIKEKVLVGYSVEDAAVAVLAKEGKLTAPKVSTNVAGGSATNVPISGESKPLSEMTRDEKRAELLKAIERGDISIN